MDVATITPDDVWVVGYYQPILYQRTRPLALHWDGAQWSQVALPDPTFYDLESVQLRSIDALATNDVWAVGEVGYMGARPVAYHWDGTQWTLASLPDPSPMSDGLRAVTMIAADDVWATGEGYSTNGGSAIVMHWDGAQWTGWQVEGTENNITWIEDIDAAAPDAIWAVGFNYTTNDFPVIMHYDGNEWQLLPTPPGGYYRLKGVEAISPTEVWAVGGENKVLRWDGAEWSQVQVPTADQGWLNSIVEIGGPNDEMWIVGRQGFHGHLRPLTIHYTGECPGTTPTPTPTCVPGWSRVPSPNSVQGENYLWSVSAADANNIWAAGYYRDAGGDARTLTMRWDGAEWVIVPSPNAGPGDNELRGIVAIAPDDVWAVGWCFGCDYLQSSLILHWDGNQWQVISPPSIVGGLLYSITATGPDDVWAAGKYGEGSLPLVIHWNGTQWAVIPTPSLPGTILNGIAVLAPNDVWVVGEQGGTFSMHWDGQDWTVIETPNPGFVENYLIGVTGLAANDVWAVGYYRSASGNSHPLITHWDGTQWSLVESPSPGTYRSYLYSIVALSPDDVWAAGSYGSDSGDPALVVRWDGTSWSQVPTFDPGADESYLHGITALSPGQLWAVGADFNQNGYRTLTARYTSGCPTATTTPPLATSSPTRTSTSPALTPTNVIPTTTVVPSITPTPTPCAITFTDVPPEHTFYPFIRCLACRGILSGYADGTFRPGNNITRGQLAKVVSSAAAIDDPLGEQRFEDVPPSHTFFTWVQRLVGRGHIGGYPCGGVGEECVPPRNLPYFRPQGEATRGQIAKIVSNAAGFSEPVSGRTFEDVAPDSPFYLWIERLAGRGIMGGYPCGGPGEPCEPGNRPYFRPGNNATRGQVSKIVANTFFPGCQSQ
jgi:photosystem II stability/assembly factor-like uncharacterized protein